LRKTTLASHPLPPFLLSLTTLTCPLVPLFRSSELATINPDRSQQQKEQETRQHWLDEKEIEHYAESDYYSQRNN
jgi:hypothetical protein